LSRDLNIIQEYGNSHNLSNVSEKMTLRKKITRYVFGLGVLLYRSLVQPFGLCKVYKEAHNLDVPAGPRPAPASITIKTQQIKGKIDPLIYGNFIEVLGKCIYGGVWDEYNQQVPLVHGGIRRDVLDEIRALKVTVLRWPGGCFSDVYEWKEGIGPRAQRKVQSNKHWHWLGPKFGPKHDNHFGSDEFMALIEELGTEPYFNINFGSGTIEEAAQWVEYMNGDERTENGALRAKNGHPKPYKVKIWGIGNELYSPTEMGFLEADAYAKRYLAFVEAMRKVDPELKFVAVGTDFLDPHWNRTLLEIAGDQIDYLSLHVYIPMLMLESLTNSVKDYYNIIAGAFEVERRIKWVQNSIQEVMGERKKIAIALDEWGPIWNIRQHYEGYYTLRDGLFAASVFEVLHRNSDSVKMANYAQLVNVVGMLVTSLTDVYHNPIYLAAQLFAQYAESYRVSTKVDCETRQNPRYGNIMDTDIPLLGCSTTINKERDSLVIIGINRHHAHDLPTTISILNFEPESNAQIFELNGPSHSAFNDFTKKNEVAIQEKAADCIAPRFVYTFPAHSVTVLMIKKKQ
jgi:alpha-L-arabinofuranosidase